MLSPSRFRYECPLKWESLTGDDRVRMCAKCQTRVTNVSELSAADAERFIQAQGGRVCVKLDHDAAGRPIHWPDLRAGAAAAALLAAACTPGGDDSAGGTPSSQAPSNDHVVATNETKSRPVQADAAGTAGADPQPPGWTLAEAPRTRRSAARSLIEGRNRSTENLGHYLELTFLTTMGYY